MLKEVETGTNQDTVTLTEPAVEAVRGILSEKNLEGYSLRVFVAGSSCCSVNFGMALDNNIGETDLIFKTQDVQLVVDDQSIEYLRGAKIDYINDPVRGSGFSVSSPSASKNDSCACGTEGHEHGEGEDSCGCGGSCSNN